MTALRRSASSRGHLPRGISLVFMTALISGVSTFANFWAVQGTNTDAFLAMRNSLVAVLLVPLALLASREVRTSLRAIDWLRLLLIGLVGGAIPFLLFFRGLQLAGAAGAATATFAYRALFLMATVLAVVFLKERFSPRIAAAAALLLAGNVLLLSLTSPVWSDGFVFVLAATVLWAVEYTVSKRTLRDLPATTVALGRMGFGAVFLVGYLGATGQTGAIASWSAPQFEWLVLSAILLLGFVSTWYPGLRDAPLSVATSVLLLGFPVTLLLSLAVGRAAVSVAGIAGIVTVAFGACLAIGLASLRDTWDYLAQIVVARLRSNA